MQLPDVVNVAIGLVVLFFLLSTIASVIAEIYGRALRYREEILYITINRLLTGLPDAPWSHGRLIRDRLVAMAVEMLPQGWTRARAWVKSWEPTAPEAPVQPGEPEENERRRRVVETFWKNETLRAMITPGSDAPVRLAKETFADLLIDQVVPRDSTGRPPADRDTLVRRLEARAEALPAHLRLALISRARSVAEEAASGPGFGAAFREAVGDWYGEAMERAGERFRRLMQHWLLWIGFILAFALNADALRVMHVLSHDKALASAAAAHGALIAAERETRETRDATGAATAGEGERDIAQAREELGAQILELQRLERLGYPIGWTFDGLMDFVPADRWVSRTGEATFWGVAGLVFFKLIGLGLTALAVSQGAPFWYDLLRKLTAFRGGKAQPEAGTKDAPGAADGFALAAAGAAAAAERGGLSIGPDLASGAPGFEPRRAYWLAVLARLAYAPEAEVARVAGDQGFAAMKFFHERGPGVDTQAFAVADRQVAVVAFRGTEPDVLADIVSDLKIRRIPWMDTDATRGEIHRGFGAAELIVAEQVLAWLRANAPAAGIIHVTGHSLGGALATLFAARLKADAELGPRLATLHTFGCPRVGDQLFTRALDRELGECVVRVVHGADPVPMVPPAGPEGYRHCGQEIQFLKPAGLRRSPGGLDRLLGLAAAAATDLRQAARDAVGDHSMDHYVERCRAAAEGR